MYPCDFGHYYSIHLLFHVLKLFYILAIFMKLLYRLYLHCYSLWYCCLKSHIPILELLYYVLTFLEVWKVLFHHTQLYCTQKIEFAFFSFSLSLFSFSQPMTESHKFYTFLRLEKSDMLVFPFVNFRNIPTHLKEFCHLCVISYQT